MSNLKNKTMLLVLNDRVGNLFEKSEVPFNDAGVQETLLDSSNVFHGCKGNGEAIQRIQELSKIGSFVVEYPEN